MDYKSIFENVKDESSFIKTTVKPVIEDTQKVSLNRKGNILYNSGDIEAARRIYLTTGYTDGLVRIGDYYKSNGRPLDALRMYWIAPDRKKAEPIINQISAIIQNMLHNEGSTSNEGRACFYPGSGTGKK
jgi:hypothetical protein